MSKLQPTPPQYLDQLNQLVYEHKLGQLPVVTLIRLYELADKMIDKIIKPTAVCSKSCSFCCYGEVIITNIEAAIIEIHTGKKAQPAPIISPIKPTVNNNLKCTFLRDDNTCGIYKVRPLVCRTFHVFENPIICKNKGMQQMIGHTPMAIGSSFLNNIAKFRVHLNGKYEFINMQDVFPYPEKN